MRQFNKQLNSDISNLKLLHSKKDKTEFNSLKAEIMSRHNISKATVYREMKKDTPGMYKTPRYYPPVRPVTIKEKQMINSLLLKGTKIQDIQKIMEDETGEVYSWDRVDMIRNQIERGELLHNTDADTQACVPATIEEEGIKHPPAFSHPSHHRGLQQEGSLHTTAGESEVNTFRLPAPQGYQQQAGSVKNKLPESGFGNDIRTLLEAVLNLDKIGVGTVVPVKIKGCPEIRLGPAVLRDIVKVISNSIWSKGADISEYSRIMALHGAAEQLRLYSNGKPASPRDYLEVLKVVKEYKKEYSETLTPDYKVFDACLAEAAPNLSEVQRWLMIVDHHGAVKGASEEAAKPIFDILKELAFEATSANM